MQAVQPACVSLGWPCLCACALACTCLNAPSELGFHDCLCCLCQITILLPMANPRSLSQTTTRSGRSVLVCNLALIRICMCANVYANVYILLIGVYPYIHLSICLSIHPSRRALRCLCQSKILLPRLRHLPLSFPRRLNAWARTQVRVSMSVRTHVWM